MRIFITGIFLLVCTKAFCYQYFFDTSNPDGSVTRTITINETYTPDQYQILQNAEQQQDSNLQQQISAMSTTMSASTAQRGMAQQVNTSN